MSQPNSFNLGQLVRPKSQPDKAGAVIAVNSSGPEIQYTILLEGKLRYYFASQLVAAEIELTTSEKMTADKCRAMLTARYINHPGTSTLYSLNAARINFIPYQFRPVLRFIRADRPRILIADGVGVGKTIEAGLILRELQARQEVNSVAIICPRPLVTEKKWLSEMKRFDQTFEHLDGPLLRHCISECDLDGYWPENHRFVIMPYSILSEGILSGTQNGRKSGKPCLLDLDPPPRFDLVIVDEAHRISNPNTIGYQVVRFFCEHSSAVVFLTATPLQLANSNLFVLLNLLRPDAVIDRQSFEQMSEPNPMIHAAVSNARSAASGWQIQALENLCTAEETAWGKTMLSSSPAVVDLKSRLKESRIAEEDRVRIIGELEELHTFSSIINRTRRRDIDSFTIRRPKTIEIDFTEAQRQLHDALLKVQAEIFAELHGSMNVKFMMTTIRRQAASCLFGLAPLIEGILSRHVSDEELSEVDVDPLQVDPDEIETIAAKVMMVAALAKKLEPIDAKLEAVVAIVRQKVSESGNHRVMVFSSFRHTLTYLFDGLQTAGIRVGLVHGGVADEERATLRQRFQKEKLDSNAIDVLLFSEVGCEGLDYQFCDCMINYDLPWNPMRIEQRIGRIDRNGQRSEFVTIYNLITPGTVDADIYQRCLLRIRIFEQALGASEEILGKITADIQEIAIDPNLSELERRERLQQLADNEIRLLQEEERLEEQQLELFGTSLPTQQRFADEVENASSLWLTPTAMSNMLQYYLSTLGDSGRIIGEGPLKTLRVNQKIRSRLLADVVHSHGRRSAIQRDWERWLKGTDSHLTITFDGHCANENQDAHLITPIHPVVRQAAKALDAMGIVEVHLSVQDPQLPKGIHPFAIFQWELVGLRPDLKIVLVTLDDTLDPNLLKAFQSATDAPNSDSRSLSPSQMNQLESRHHTMWSEALGVYRKEVTQLARYKRTSLSVSHQARMAILEEQLATATEERIRRMRHIQCENAKRDYEMHSEKLRIASERGDITSELIIKGSIEIS